MQDSNQLPVGRRTYTADWWASGWTSITPFHLGSQSYYLIYNKTNGTVHMDRVSEDGRATSTVWSWTWSAGWTHFVPFTMSGQQYIIAYNSSSGEVHFDRVRPNAQGVDILWMGRWGTGFTHFVPFYVGDHPHLIAYNSDTGLVHFDRITDRLNGVDVASSLTWASGFDQFVPYVFNGENRLVAYNSATGLVHFDRILPALNGVDVLGSGTWARGWRLTGYDDVNGEPHLIAYNAGTGLVHQDRLGHSGMQILQVGYWKTGQSHVVGLNVRRASGAPRGFVLGYSTTAGGATITMLDDDTEHLACDATDCRIRDLPLLHQTDPALPADVAAQGPLGCYDASIAMAAAGALANRSPSASPLTATRTRDFDALVSSWPATSSNADLLAFQYRTAKARDPYYFHELLQDFSPIERRVPAACDPRAYGSCKSADSRYGDAYRIFVGPGDFVSDDLFVRGVRQKVMQIIAFDWTRNTTVDGRLVLELANAGHKVAVSGFRRATTSHPVLVNDPGANRQRRIHVGVLEASSRLVLPNGAASWPYVEFSDDPAHAKLLLMHYDGVRLN
ncbi:hypothetical protein [Sorangium sp. So ce131]|uniref:hypothetical protein n=1 Tax=Sorangium sp. So ce131 TaxID=3133282 RepID=UPI003F61A939